MHTVKRLITEFIPRSYNLSLVVDRPGRAFTGTLTVSGTVVDTKAMLHAHELAITSVTVNGMASEWSLGRDDELTIGNLQPGNYTIVIVYSGKISDQLHGLYPCTYTYNGEPKELLATQFESHYAREVFPCVDEPAAKATFDITLTTEQGVTVLGNMPIKAQNVETGKLVTHFEQTPRMSTYLVAFVIGDLQKATAKTNTGVEVNVFATPAQPAESLAFALEHAVKTIEYFNDYFDIPYPLPKSDQVALPDFSNGAMENWGLITYRESALLYDPATTSIASKQYIATVISHELSHQWFGNLVTMAWWDDLWLNESFATIMEYICVDALYPDWHVWLDFNTGESVYALRRDSLAGVQAVKVAVHHPDEIQSVFDGAIVYAKGARLMQMMQHYVGEQAFRDGLTAYFNAHAYGNTTGNDLWDALQSTSGKPVGDFMNTWLSQSGFPVVRAVANGGNIELTQRQFLIGPSEPNDKLWPIPLGATADTLPTLFPTKHAAFAATNHHTFRLNKDDTAHFITSYSDELLHKILADIKNGNASISERAQIIKEQLLLVKSDEAGSETLIPLLLSYKNETNEKVWGMLSGLIADLKRFVDPETPAEKSLKQIALQAAAPLYGELGWQQKPAEPADDTMLRATIIGAMLYGEHPDTIVTARKLYATHKLSELDAELRDLVLIAEVRHGDTKQAIKNLLGQYKTSSSVDIKNDITDAVCSTRDTSELQHLLGLLKDTTLIKTQDTAMWYARLLSNRDGRTLTWQWLQDNWEWIKQTFGGDKSYDTFPRLTGQVLATREQLNGFKQFFEPMLNDTALKRAISVGLNDIEARVQLLESDKRAVEQALLNYHKAS